MNRLVLKLSFVLISTLGFAQIFTNKMVTSNLNPNLCLVHEVFDYNNDGYEDLIYTCQVSQGYNRLVDYFGVQI